jgi:hypothetical protein
VRPLRTDTEGPVPAPVSEADSRPETERREACEEERDEREELADDERPDSAPGRGEGTAGGAGGAPGAGARPGAADPPDAAAGPDPPGPPDPPGAAWAGAAAGSGARPQVSQYSPPSPMSSKVPSQPGRWHLLTISPSHLPLRCRMSLS